MNNRAIFIQDHAPRTSRTVTLANGGVAYPYSDLAIGRIVGQYRTLRAAMTDDASDKDLWSIINLRHPVSRAHLGTVAILGALDDDQAKLFAVKTFGLEYENVEAAYDCIKAAPIALQRVLNREAAQGNFALTQEMLDRAARQISDRPVIWDSKNEANLVSHGGNASELLHEMVRYDSERQLTDSMNSADMACLLKEIGADDIDDEHNALIIEYGKFDTFMSRLTQAMSKASDKLKISDAQPTKPFKRNNVVNVAVQYSLSDGQSMTVVFHNPDSTPSKLQARDTLTSWKFMLNKRDITAAVSPENGKNVQLPVLAKRMMLLAEKNSAAFARANKNKAQKEADLVALEADNSKAQERIAGIVAENESLQKEIDAVVVGRADDGFKPSVAGHLKKIEIKPYNKGYGVFVSSKDSKGKIVENLYASEPLLPDAEKRKAQAENLYFDTPLPAGVYTTTTFNGKKYEGLSEQSAKIEARKRNHGIEAGKEWVVEDSYPGLKNASVTFDNGQRRVTMTVNGVREWSGGNSVRVYFDLEFTKKRTPVSSFYEVLSGSTNDHVIEMDGRKFAYKTGVDAMSVSKRTAIRLAMDELVSQLLSGPEMVQPEPASESIAAPEPSPMNPDLDYLQSVIDGKVDFTDGETIENTLEEMAGRVGEDNPLFIKAVDAYAAYQVEQASKLGV